MYTILVKSDDTLVTTNRETITHRSSLVRKLRFLVDPVYGDDNLNMSEYACILEYVLPISKEYTPVVLTPSTELYKEKLEYILDIDTEITSEVGEVQLKLMWTKPELLADGSFGEHVRKTLSTTITVLPVEQWSDYIASSNLDSIAQMILTSQAQLEQMNVYAEMLTSSKGDSLSYNPETNELQLKANDEPISSVILEECDLEDGVPAVDFDEVIEPVEPGETDNVVEF